MSRRPRSIRVVLRVSAVLLLTTLSVTPAHAEESAFPLRYETASPYVGVVQDRLAWLGYDLAPAEVAEQRLGNTTLRSLRAFQRKFWLDETTMVTTKAWNELRRIAGPIGVLPKACTEVTSICISKSQKLLRFVEDGAVRMATDARFGIPGNETSEGVFAVQRKSRNHFSSRYETSMPFSLFYYRGEAVHYSDFFHRDGYSGGSHGCVNLRERAKARWLFDRTSVGTRVVIS